MVGWLTDSMDISLSRFLELVMDRETWHAAVHGVAKSCTQLRDRSITLPGFVFPKFNLEKHKISNWWNTATIIN